MPAKLAARVRHFDTGLGRKTDARDAHSIAVVAVRTDGLRVLQVDGELEALRMLVERLEALTHRRVQSVNRLQALLAELLPDNEHQPAEKGHLWKGPSADLDTSLVPSTYGDDTATNGRG